MSMSTSMPVEDRSTIHPAFSLIDASILASVAVPNNLVETPGSVFARAMDGAEGLRVLWQTTTGALAGKSDERILDVTSADARYLQESPMTWSNGCHEEETRDARPDKNSCM
jgi:hypothetical protein